MKLRLFLLCLFLACAAAPAQRVTDSGYRTVAHIKSDGTVQDASFRIIGHIKADGMVQDENFRVVGYLKDNGLVQDASYRTIGHADGIPMKWAAWHFFFSKR